ncbi:unnamed protein product [Oikopleura dioica]|uniref:Uncharacterized protein n=1 Tax=Oikopleura dioica TaxID=34765 RepID=E4XVI0_OIKDI|nr:unnamed protein product [Oikopleura dioica]
MTEDNNDKCIKPSSSTPYTYCEKNSCQAVIRSYKLDGIKFYFAQRGCTQRPEDGIAPNTATVNPADFYEKDDFPQQMVTNVDTIVQRSIIDLGNNYQSYKLDVATSFECIFCKGEASVTLKSSVNLDNANLGLCWNIETGQSYNGVSCDSQCYTKATMLSHGNKTHVTYTMSAERGCRESSITYLAEQKEISKFHNAAEKDEEVETLLRKADHLATLASSELNTIEKENAEPEMSASTIDQKYFELVALADRLSGVSKQLKEESKKRRPMEQQLSLAADSANCTSSRLRARADKLTSCMKIDPRLS